VFMWKWTLYVDVSFGQNVGDLSGQAVLHGGCSSVRGIQDSQSHN
jgi:hypothetical protein